MDKTEFYRAFVAGGKAVVSFSRAFGEYETIKDKEKAKKDKDVPWVHWGGAKNNEPERILEFVKNNHLNPGILRTKIDLILGNGLYTFKSDNSSGKTKNVIVNDPVIERFIHDSNLNRVYEKVITDYQFFGSAYMEFIYNALGQIVKVNHVDATYIRSGKINHETGYADAYFHCTNWQKPVYDVTNAEAGKNNVTAIPAYTPDMGRVSKCLFKISSHFPGHPYYSPPEWCGVFHYIDLANQIPEFHANALRNGYNIRYHIVIPKSYIDQFPEDRKEHERKELRKNLDTFLSGTDNVMKSFISFKTQYASGNGSDEWEIKPIQSNLSDTAYTTLFEQTNEAIISGHAIDPSLCAIERPGKLSSGSEKRIAYDIHTATKLPRPRRICLEPLHIIAKTNSWDPDVKFGFLDTQITTLDVNPTGVQTAGAVQPN